MLGEGGAWRGVAGAAGAVSVEASLVLYKQHQAALALYVGANRRRHLQRLSA